MILMVINFAREKRAAVTGGIVIGSETDSSIRDSMFRRRDAGQAHNVGNHLRASALDDILRRVILVAMSFDPMYRLMACLTTRKKRRPASLPVAVVVLTAVDRRFVTDQPQQ